MKEVNLNFRLGRYEADVLRSLKAIHRNNIVQRILAREHTVWKEKPDNIINRLGWLDAPDYTLKRLSYIRSVLDPIIAENYEHAVLLGMGGSSLAAEVFAGIFGNRKGYPLLHIMDTTDPVAVSRISRELNMAQTLFIVSSKSGTTMETALLFNYFYNFVLKKLNRQARNNFIIITDPGSPLEELAHRLSLRHVFLNKPDIGGRFSALSFPGIVPAALIGIDVEKLLVNALSAVRKESNTTTGLLNSTGTALGTTLGTLAGKGRDKLTMIFPPSWQSFGGWLEQLIAESTGKEGKGIVPICNEKPDSPSCYKQDRLFVIFSGHKKISSEVQALIDAGHPVIIIGIDNKYQLGAHMFCWEMATAVASHILHINPFDQPDVESTKIITRRIIDLYRHQRELPQEIPSINTAEFKIYGSAKAALPGAALTEFLSQAAEDSYVCLQSYLSETAETNKALLKLSKVIEKKYRQAVTIAYGPSYLHSTGQLHKGDVGRGLFIQFTSDDLQDVEIPDRPGFAGSTLTFGALKAAQALGDMQALIGLKRKIIRFHLQKDPVAGIKAMAVYLQKN